jgi:hypothetical protein
VAEETEKKAAHWEKVSGLVAIAIGVLALGVSIYTAYLQRKQSHAAVWPRLEAGYSDADGFTSHVENKGVGPAIVRFVEVRVDGRPVATWDDAMKTLLGRGSDQWKWSSLHEAVLTPGERIDALVFKDASEARLVEESWVRVTATICYCSIFDDCWSYDGETKPVASCPTPGASSFKQ